MVTAALLVMSKSFAVHLSPGHVCGLSAQNFGSGSRRVAGVGVLGAGADDGRAGAVMRFDALGELIRSDIVRRQVKLYLFAYN